MQDCDPAAHTIDFYGAGADAPAASLTLAQVAQKFEQKRVTSVMQCAGNRAVDDIAATGPSGFSGIPFERIKHGMMGNILWSGAPLGAPDSPSEPSPRPTTPRAFTRSVSGR